MAAHEKRYFVICYDISDRRRLARVHRHVSARALRLQYSVYLFYGSDESAGIFMDELADIIDPRADDVRSYKVPKRGELYLAGNRLEELEIYLLGEGIERYTASRNVAGDESHEKGSQLSG